MAVSSAVSCSLRNSSTRSSPRIPNTLTVCNWPGAATRRGARRCRRSGVLQRLQRARPGALADHALDPLPARPAAGAGPGGGGDGLDRGGAVVDRRAYPVTRYRTADTCEHAVATPLVRASVVRLS